MQNKEQKKTKNNNNQNINSSSNNKNLEEYFLINKLIQRNKNSKSITNNNSNSNILRANTLEPKVNANTNSQNKSIKNNTLTDNDKQNITYKDKEKKTKSIFLPPSFHDKIGSEKKATKTGGAAKKKTPIKLEVPDKKNKNKLSKRISGINDQKKNPFLKSKYSNEINDKKKKNDGNNKNKNNKKETNKKDKIENGLNTQKLLEFLISLSPIDTSKCDDLISNNMNKIIELENKIKEISKITDNEIKKITNDENNKNKITTKQNIEIINKESKMRKEIYILFFNFIMGLLEQINKLSNHIANQEINDLNIKDNNSSSNDNLFINSNNGSDMSNNSLFVSNIEEEFCEKLINITKSFISSDIDLNDLRSNFDNPDNQSERINLSRWNKIENGDMVNGGDNKIIDFNDNDYDLFLKNHNKKMIMIHPNEILNKIQNEEKKNKKVIHHYSNSLKVNSNLEKLEGKINNDDDNINSDIIGNIGNLEKLKNCQIF